MSTAKQEEAFQSFSSLVAMAEVLKNKTEYAKAKKLYEKALTLEPGEPFLLQRIALLTYKTGRPGDWKTLSRAWEILLPLKPERSKDPETLGLSGSVFKRMYEVTDEPFMLDRAIEFYQKGYEGGDYYNGINLAYVYLQKALMEKENNRAQRYYDLAGQVNTDIVRICRALIASPGFEHNIDREYIYQSLAQAYLGLKQDHEVVKLIPTINEVSKGNFDMDTFHEQNNKLVKVIACCRHF